MSRLARAEACQQNLQIRLACVSPCACNSNAQLELTRHSAVLRSTNAGTCAGRFDLKLEGLAPEIDAPFGGVLTAFVLERLWPRGIYKGVHTIRFLGAVRLWLLVGEQGAPFVPCGYQLVARKGHGTYLKARSAPSLGLGALWCRAAATSHQGYGAASHSPDPRYSRMKTGDGMRLITR